jgi:hypothetical protein
MLRKDRHRKVNLLRKPDLIISQQAEKLNNYIMAWLDTITLASYHSLILPHTIEEVKLEEVAKVHRPGMRIESFGLFDTAAPNFSNYYPNVTAKDFNPEEDEFILPTYRALSEVIVHRNWNPVDFSMNGILKRSMKLLQGQTIYPNHENAVGNELGAVLAVAWEESYTVDGIKVPAGINSKFKIDAKSNPKIARAINMDPPAVHSTSVTVEFLWEKSHATMTEEEFWRGLGKFDKDGNMIRRIATAINRYNEISLVTKGADPFAQKVGKDGAINNPKEAGVRDQQTGKGKLSQKFFFYDYQTDLLKNNSSVRGDDEDEEVTIPNEINNKENQQNDNNMNKQFLLALAAIMGLTGDKYAEATITEDQIKVDVTILAQQNALLAKFKELGITIEKAEDIQSIKDSLERYNAVKDKDVASLEAFRTSIVTELRDKTKAVYLKLNGDKPNDAILAMLENATREVLVGLTAQYEAELEAKFPMSCTDRGSHAISRATATKPDTSKTDKGSESGKEEGKEKVLNLQEVIARKKAEGSIKIGLS